MTEKIIGFLIGVLLLFWMIFFNGCEATKIREQVLYEDGTPVVNSKVHMYTEEGYNGYTVTDENGEWTIVVPSNSLIYLCIENPLLDNEMSCYDGILTTEKGELNEKDYATNGTN